YGDRRSHAPDGIGRRDDGDGGRDDDEGPRPPPHLLRALGDQDREHGQHEGLDADDLDPRIVRQRSLREHVHQQKAWGGGQDLADEVPNIRELMARGMHGDLASITPPITVPGWACAMTGKTPGQLGIYGFRNRKDSTYEGLSIATSDAVKEPAVWDLLGRKGLKSLLIGVPPSYPPKPVEGWRISCFLTPPSAKTFAYPADVMAEVEDEVGAGNYIFDIPNFRDKGYEFVLDQVFKMTERRFAVARRLVT